MYHKPPIHRVTAQVKTTSELNTPTWVMKLISILKKPLILVPVLVLILIIGAWVYFPPFVQIEYTLASAEPFEQVNTPDKVMVNTATVAEIAVLPNIGDKTAQAIVEYRTVNGNFTRLEDLLNVKGIGEKTLDKIKDLIIL